MLPQIAVASLLDVPTRAVLTRMDVPIGRAVGNALEVAESIRCLRGQGPQDLEDLVCALGEGGGTPGADTSVQVAARE